jgi:hypothetical protein
MARCGCGGACSCALVAGSNISLLGSGTPANPWIVSAQTNPAQVRAALTSGQSTVYNPSDGSFDLCLSGDANNAASFGTDGCLFVGAGASTVTTGPGITGNGAPGTPVAANAWPWLYSCDLNTWGGKVYVDPLGRLRTDPSTETSFQDMGRNFTPPSPVAIPAGSDVVIDSISITLTNPDGCRQSLVILQREFDVQCNLPPNSGGDFGMDTDNMLYHFNNGTTTVTGVHTQLARWGNLTLNPGEVRTVTANITAGRGTGGATFTSIDSVLRAWTITFI